MEVACGMNCTYPTELLNRWKQGGSSIERSLMGTGLGEKVSQQNRNPSPCLYPLPRQPPVCVCVKNLSNHLLSPLEWLLVRLLPFLAQQMRSQKSKSSKGFKPLLIAIMGTKQRTRMEAVDGDRRGNAAFQIDVCIHTCRKTLSTHTNTYTCYFHISLWGKVFNCLPTKNTEKGSSL